MFANEVLLTAVGRDEASTLGFGWLASLHPDDRETRLGMWKTAASQGKLPWSRFRQRVADGSYRWCEGGAGAIRDHTGAIVALVGAVIDVHEAVVMRGRLEEERALLEAVLDSLPVGIGVVKNSGVFTTNTRATEMFGLPAPGVARWVAGPSAAWKGMHLDGRAFETGDWPVMRTLRSGEAIRDEEALFLRPDGSVGSLLISSAPVHSATGEMIAAVGACLDVTELRRMQEAEGRRIAAEQLAEAARNLVSNCSHELRTVRGWCRGPGVARVPCLCGSLAKNAHAWSCRVGSR
jgi:PAS domain S-box-containing protein